MSEQNGIIMIDGKPCSDLVHREPAPCLQSYVDAELAALRARVAELEKDAKLLDYVLERLEISDPQNSSTSFETREAIEKEMELYP